MLKEKKWIIAFSNIAYILGCVALYLAAIGIIIYSIIAMILQATQDSFEIYKILDEVGLLVFAITVIDVTKYIVVEEVLRGTVDRRPEEQRHTLTKIVTIVSTAVFLKGLVMAIEVSKVDIANLVYPLLMLITPVFLMVGLGVYQKLNAAAEKD